MSYPIYNGVFKRSINVVFSVDLLISLDRVYRDTIGFDSLALIAFFSTDHQTGENKLLLDAEHLYNRRPLSSHTGPDQHINKQTNSKPFTCCQ